MVDGSVLILRNKHNNFSTIVIQALNEANVMHAIVKVPVTPRFFQKMPNINLVYVFTLLLDSSVPIEKFTSIFAEVKGVLYYNTENIDIKE